MYMSLFAARYKCVITMSSRACYPHMGPRPKLEDAPNMWRRLKRWPRTSFPLATTLGDQQGRPSQGGGPNRFNFESDSESKSSSTKTDTQVTNGVGFGHSLYGWKDNFKTLPMALVSIPNTSGVDRNCPRKLTSSVCPGAAMPSFGLWALNRVGAH